MMDTRRNFFSTVGLGAVVTAIGGKNTLASEKKQEDIKLEGFTARLRDINDPKYYYPDLPEADYYDLQRLLEIAADRNIVVYDADSKVGEITRRLVFLMKAVYNRNTEGKLYHIYIPSFSYPVDFDPHNKIFGITFTSVDDLDEDMDSLVKYYKEELGGSLVAHRDSLVIGIGEGGPILGCT